MCRRCRVRSRYFPPGNNSQTWNIFDPTVGVQYHFTEDIMGYTSWGKGFKAGGWTTRLSAPDTPAAAEFQPEYTKTWEVGVKSDWLGDQPASQRRGLLHGL